MNEAYICDAIRTPIGRYGGALSSIRTDDLAALPLKALIERNPGVDWHAVDDVIFGCANQAGEDNRNVARMAALQAGLPVAVPGATVNRLCGSGLDAVGIAARAIKCGEAGLKIAGGVESMSRAPFVMPKAQSAFDRNHAIYETTIGWRFVNLRMREQYGIDSMPETAENVATDYGVEREAQDRMALASQLKAAAAQRDGHLAREIVPVVVMVGLGAFCLFEIRGENLHVAEFRDNWLPSVRASQQMLAALRQVRINEYRVVASQTPTAIQDAEIRIESGMADYRQAAAEYEKLITEPEEKAAYAEIRTQMPQKGFKICPDSKECRLP